MYPLSPAFAVFLLHGPASKIQPWLIEESAVFVQTGHPDHDGSRVGHIPEAFFTFLQCGLSPFALGDIETDTGHADGPAGVVEVDLTPSEQPVDAPVRPYNSEFSIPEPRLLDRFPLQFLQAPAVGRMN